MPPLYHFNFVPPSRHRFHSFTPLILNLLFTSLSLCLYLLLSPIKIPQEIKMFTKTLLLSAGLAALVAADPIPQAASTTSYDLAAISSELASLTASIDSIPSGATVPGLPSIYSDFPTLPLSIESVLATAIPSGEVATQTDPCAFVTDAPKWYNSLPASVKSALTSYESALVSWEKEHSKDLTGQASYTANVPALVCTATGAAGVKTTAKSTAKNTGTAGGSTATSTGAGSSPSKAAAPRATGAVAISFAGAMGVLGFMAAV